MINICTLFWDWNKRSLGFSRVYDEEWVEKLYRGFARNLTVPFRFICFTDKIRTFSDNIDQELLIRSPPDYGSCIEPYKLGEPMILVGLDTVITGNIDHLADYCMQPRRIALPRAVYKKNTVCNGVALVSIGHTDVWSRWNGENDMEWMRQQDYVVIDDLWPGQVVSYKGHVKAHGLGDARIVFFHGEEKPHQLPNVGWLRKHWV
jgi:hypothetical protein